MKTIYLECQMGAAGDMLFSSLLELHPNPTDFLHRFSRLLPSGVTVKRLDFTKCGILGTALEVTVHGEKETTGGVSANHNGESSITMDRLKPILAELPLPQQVREDVFAVYQLLAEAESTVHGVPVQQVHFHELGMLDALTDILGVCMLFHELSPERIVSSPVTVGFGKVRCAHGALPIPAPATAHLLKGIPICSGAFEGELCTPTGAALLKHFVHDFAPMNDLKIQKIGYGMGKKDFPAANCLRAFLGESEALSDQILEICCNLDDMTPEGVGFAMEQLLQGGALDVYTTPITMKKCRPAVLLTCLCRLEDHDRMVGLCFRYTTTIGVRTHLWNRCVLERSEETRKTQFGAVRVKRSAGWGVVREKAEYDDLAEIARKEERSLADITSSIRTNQEDPNKGFM